MPVGAQPRRRRRPTRGRVYVVGGYRGRSTLDDEVATLYRYDPRRDRWTRLPSAPTRARRARRRRDRRTPVRGRRRARAGAARSPRSRSTTSARRRWSTGPDLAARARAPRRRGGRRPLLRARRARRRPGQLRARRGRYDPRDAGAGRACADMAQGRAAASPPPRPAGGSRSSAARRARARSARSSSTTRRATAGAHCPGMRTPRHGLGGVASGRRVYAIEGGDQPGFHFTRAIEYLDLPR